MNSAPVAWSSLLILLIGGCQQHSNSAIPLSPINPMGTNTRVPPPQTGSYAVPNGYYQGQAAVAPSSSGQYAASGQFAPAVMAPAGMESAATEQAVIGAGAAGGGDLVANEIPILNGWSDASGGGSVAGSGVQPAAYQGAQPTGSAGIVSHGGTAPRIPASALSQTAGGGTPLRPNLRGMAVVDMTAPATLQPTDPPSLRAIDDRQTQAATTVASSSAAPTFRSLSPADAGVRPVSHHDGMSSSASAPGTSASGTSASGGPREVPSTSKASQTGTSTADLPWRKPTR